MEEKNHHLSAEQLEEIRQSFNAIDINSDGRISARELMRAQQALGLNPTKAEVKAMIKEVDTDGSGYIELDEYIELMAERYGALEYEADMMKAAFEHFDRDRSGYLSKDELLKYLTRCGDKLTIEEFDKVVSDIDRDGNGKVDLKALTHVPQILRIL